MALFLSPKEVSLMGLTPKQKIFADEYLIDLNATRAYKVAYSRVKKDSVAAANGARLLRNDKVANYVNEELEKLRSERVADAQEVMEHLTAVMRGEIDEDVVVVEGVGDGCSEARVVQKQISERDRLKAAELLAKRYGILTEKVQVTGLDSEKTKLDDLLRQMRGDG